MVPVASLAAYQAGDWATFVRDLLQAYPEQKERAVSHSSDLVNLVRRVSNEGKPDTSSGILAFHKEFEPIAKDCLARGQITKHNEAEIFLEGIHHSVVEQVEAQARNKSLLKAWAQANGILAAQQPPAHQQQEHMLLFELLSKGTNITTQRRQQQPVGEYTIEQLLVELENLYDSQKNAFNGLTRSLIAEIKDNNSRQGSKTASSKAPTASAPPAYGTAVSDRLNFSTSQQTHTLQERSHNGLGSLNQTT